MQTQSSREDKTVAIATALGIFVIVLAAGSTLLWAFTSALDVRDHGTSPLFLLLVAASVIAAVAHLLRAGKRSERALPSSRRASRRSAPSHALR